MVEQGKIYIPSTNKKDSLQKKRKAGTGGGTQTRRENPNGLPAGLQSGLEALSGYDMSDVSVIYNSSRPASFGAHAVAQGDNIDLGPGQEKHLPHEAWHVVQQKQGRVTANADIGGTPINTEASLENEADVMGAKAVSQFHSGVSLQSQNTSFFNRPAQLKTEVKLKTQELKWKRLTGGADVSLQAGRNMRAILDWTDPLTGSSPGGNKALMDDLHKKRETKPSKFIKGHLLNDHLGGLGVWENMFPITSNANVQHLANMERYAKQYLLDANEKDAPDVDHTSVDDDKHLVTYNVDAVPARPNDFLTNPNGTLHCHTVLFAPARSGGAKVKEHATTIDSDMGIHVGQNESLGNIGWLVSGSGVRSGDTKVVDGKGKVMDESEDWDGNQEYYATDAGLSDMGAVAGPDPDVSGVAEADKIIKHAKAEWGTVKARIDFVNSIKARLDKQFQLSSADYEHAAKKTDWTYSGADQELHAKYKKMKGLV